MGSGLVETENQSKPIYRQRMCTDCPFDNECSCQISELHLLGGSMSQLSMRCDQSLYDRPEAKTLQTKTLENQNFGHPLLTFDEAWL